MSDTVAWTLMFAVCVLVVLGYVWWSWRNLLGRYRK